MGTQAMITVSEKTTIKISLTLLVSTFIAVLSGVGFAIRVDMKLNDLIEREAMRHQETRTLMDKQLEDRMDIIRIKAHLKIGAVESATGDFNAAINR